MKKRSLITLSSIFFSLSLLAQNHTGTGKIIIGFKESLNRLSEEMKENPKRNVHNVSLDKLSDFRAMILDIALTKEEIRNGDQRFELASKLNSESKSLNIAEPVADALNSDSNSSITQLLVYNQFLSYTGILDPDYSLAIEYMVNNSKTGEEAELKATLYQSVLSTLKILVAADIPADNASVQNKVKVLEANQEKIESLLPKFVQKNKVAMASSSEGVDVKSWMQDIRVRVREISREAKKAQLAFDKNPDLDTQSPHFGMKVDSKILYTDLSTLIRVVDQVY